ncbi:hypothetical protein KAR26_00440 [Candidatus Parcubacteria bacterium]|nr:hypothetical protein [Candidatus Parcubacteria bacterium]
MQERNLVLVPGFSMETPEKRLGGLFPFLHKNNINFDIIDYLAKVIAEKSLIGWNLDKAVEEARVIIKAKKLRARSNAFVYSYGLPVVSQLSEELNFDTIIFYAPVFGHGTVVYRENETQFLADPVHFPGFAELESKNFWHKIWYGLMEHKKNGTKMIFFLPPENKLRIRQDGRTEYTKKIVEEIETFGEVRTLPEPNHYIEGNNLEEIKKCILEGN